MQLDKLNSFYNQKSSPQKGDYRIKTVKNTNLYLLVTSDNSLGILLSNIVKKPKFPKYKNIEVIYKDSVKNKNKDEIINNCFIIIAKEDIDPKLFQEVLYKYLGDKSGKVFFKVSDIRILLDKLAKMTKIEIVRKEAIIGAFGEMRFIDELINVDLDDNLKTMILRSWESENSRTIIDFNFDRAKIKIEVKTTMLDTRYHHIMDMEQLNWEEDEEGYLLSNCIVESNQGMSNLDLVNRIKDKLLPNARNILERKIEMRGPECLDNKIKFIVNNNLPSLLYEFENVPKPGTNEFIDRLSWHVHLDDIDHIDQDEHANIIEKIRTLLS